MNRRGRKQSGFIFIIGWRVLSTRERDSEVRATCPGCKVAGARLVGLVRRAWFTMFFIPLVPIEGKDRARRVSQCRECRQTFDMPIEQLARRAGAAAGNGFAGAIALYNQLRDNPADGQLMLQLLKAYDAMGEPAEAESAARHFPRAMAAEPLCGALLETIRHSARE